MSKTPIPESVDPLKTEFELNNNSNKYNWNESFAQRVAQKMFDWFSADEFLWFYSDYPRKELKITFNQFMRKMGEFPLVWDDLHNEMKLITTTRLATAMLRNKVSVPGAIQALKNMGEKWNDKMEVNHNVKSIGEVIQDAWNEVEEGFGEEKTLKKNRKQIINAPIQLSEKEKEDLYRDLDNPPL